MSYLDEPSIYRQAAHIPVFDDETGSINFDPQLAYPSAFDHLESLFREWCRRREVIFQEMDEMINTLNDVQQKCNISTTAGSAVGIVGGVVTIAGTVMFPPAMIVGAVVAGVSTVSNLTTSLYHDRYVKTQCERFKDLISADKIMVELIVSAFNEVCRRQAFNDEQFPKVGTRLIAKIAHNVLSGTVRGAVGIGTRALIKQSARITPRIAKGLVRGAGGLGILLDVISLKSSVKDLKKGSISELSKKFIEVKITMRREIGEMHDFIDSLAETVNCESEILQSLR